MNLSVFIFIVLLAVCVNSKHMPKRIKTCRRNDPNLSECFERNANLAMKYIAEGDKEFNMPTLLPLKWKDTLVIVAPTTPSFTINLRNITAFGVENMRLTNTSINLDTRYIEYIFVNPAITWECEYIASVVINNNIEETNGKAQISFLNASFLMQFNYDLNNNNGTEYAEITSHNATFIKYENTFDLQNIALNDIVRKQWKKAQKYFVNDAVRSACSETVAEYFNNIFKNVPFDLIFPY